MGRHKHRPGRAGTWIEVKVIRGHRYVYERTRVYEDGGGRVTIKSKYLGKAAPDCKVGRAIGRWSRTSRPARRAFLLSKQTVVS